MCGVVDKGAEELSSNQTLTLYFPMILCTGSSAAAAGRPEEETADPGEAHRDTEGWTNISTVGYKWA